MKHKQVTLKDNDGDVEVDSGIAPLIKGLWKAGIDTYSSCEDNLGYVYITFTVQGSQQFLNAVSECDLDPHGLYCRMFRMYMLPHGGLDGCWRYDIRPMDVGLCSDGSFAPPTVSHSGKVNTVFEVTVRFPCSDYKEVLRRMSEHNLNQAIAG